jgi:hypothetical protein
MAEHLRISGEKGYIRHGDGGDGSSHYDVACTISSRPATGAVVIRYPFPRSVQFPEGLTGSQGVCVTAATSDAEFSLKKNGVEFGTMTFATGQTTATFAAASATTFNTGDVLTVVAPTQDATLSDIGFGLAGEVL